MKNILVYGIALLFALYGCEQLTENKETSVPQPKLVADAESLAAAFADPDAKLIEIQDNIKADSLKLLIPAGDKTIYITGGKETAIGSLELSAGSHVKIMNGSSGTAKSVGSALVAAYSEQDYDGWATLVIWNHFKIPEGAAFDLTGKVRLVFRVAEIDGDLSAGLEDSLLGAGESAPVITGKGNVQTSSDAGATTPELAAADIKNSEKHKTPPIDTESLIITSTGKGIMAKGETRQFTANRPVTWTVEGGSDTGGTSITGGGLLTVGAGETNITLTVKAADGEDSAAETVKVKGWKTAAGIKNIFANFPVNGIAYGNGIWVAAGGGSGADGAKMAYSLDGGESWTKVTPTPAMNKAKDIDKALNNVIFDGPEGGKKFIAFGRVRIMPSSEDGVVWQDAQVFNNDKVFESYDGAYGNGMFIAAGHIAWPGEGQFSAATSSNGTLWEWTTQTGEIADMHSSYSPLYSSPYIGYGIAYGGGKFIMPFGPAAAIAKMTGGADMTLAANAEITAGDLTIPAKGYTGALPSTPPSFKKVLFAGGQWIVGGGGGVLAFSSDTVTWSPVVVSVFNNGEITSIASGGGRLAIGVGGKFAYTKLTPLPVSADSEWTLVTFSGESVKAVCFGGNKVIAAGSSGWLAIAHEETLE